MAGGANRSKAGLATNAMNLLSVGLSLKSNILDLGSVRSSQSSIIVTPSLGLVTPVAT